MGFEPTTFLTASQAFNAINILSAILAKELGVSPYLGHTKFLACQKDEKIY